MSSIGSNSMKWLCLGLLASALGCDARNETMASLAANAAPIAQGVIVARHDKWASERFVVEQPSEVRVHAKVKGGPAVDLYVMSEADFNQWNTLSPDKASQSVHPTFDMTLSLEGLSAEYTSDWSTLTAGNYYVVVDNTSYGGTTPPSRGKHDTGTVRFSVAGRALTP